MMIWLIGAICFVAGICVGAMLFKQFKSDAAKVEQLEGKLSELQSEHDHYKNTVHSHFSGTAHLIDNLTDSYKEVYRHLATGAQTLCPENISNQLSVSAQSSDLIAGAGFNATNKEESDNLNLPFNAGDSLDPMFPPRDYADKTSPDQKGNLAEDYGLDKTAEEQESTKTPEQDTQ